MRRESKSFTVEVKRRPAVASKKPRPFAQAQPETQAPAPAEALFRAPEASPEPAKNEPPARRILPCLVTEAAIDAAKAEAMAEHEPAPRPRGRPRKQRPDGELASAAPRKRGRPRKAPAAPPTDWAATAPPPPTPAVQPVVLVPYQPSERSVARRSAVAGLPRGERWKRRLPKALR